jgi:hypothetical protein
MICLSFFFLIFIPNGPKQESLCIYINIFFFFLFIFLFRQRPIED